jgi:cellulose synthase/poly-beta-1,6-N-acetylglucosamine synthase-like glycosyltransferase
MSALALVHSYVLYPIILFAVASRRQMDDQRSPTRHAERGIPPLGPRPRVSLLVAAYNEETVIRSKIENSLALRYPKELLEIVIASDGSTDRTVPIAEEYSDRGVTVCAYAERRGKPATLDRALGRTSGEILVLSDANTFLDAGSVEMLVRHFVEERVGAVCGELILETPGGSVGEEERYWRYEQTLKVMESATGTALGANGGIYAIRRSLLDGIPENLLIDDFVIPMRAVEKGFRIVYDPEAVGREETAPDAASEFRRRIRIGAGGFQALWLLRGLLNPRRGFVSFAFFSHKLLRWLGPFFLLAMLASSLLLASKPAYAVAASVQGGLYALAAAGALMERSGRTGGPLRKPFYFVMINAALIIGCVRWMLGTQRAAWERTARREAA